MPRYTPTAKSARDEVLRILMLRRLELNRPDPLFQDGLRIPRSFAEARLADLELAVDLLTERLPPEPEPEPEAPQRAPKRMPGTMEADLDA